MGRKAQGKLRRSQVITTYGPGALLDLPHDSAIVGGLEGWGKLSALQLIDEPRLSAKLQILTGVKGAPLYTPPAASSDFSAAIPGITVWRFPEWFIVQQEVESASGHRSRRLVHRKALDAKGSTFEGVRVVATRFVRACVRGHIDDIDWYLFVHGKEDPCRRPLWLDEKGTSGDLSEISVRCECGKSRGLYEASATSQTPALGYCRGERPWLGRHSAESCNQPSRLLIRTASNSYFPQVVSVLSLPDRTTDLDNVVQNLWDDLQIVDTINELTMLKKKAKISDALASYLEQEVLEVIARRKKGKESDRPVKQVELDALISVPEGYGEDAPIDPNFHARRLPDHALQCSKMSKGLASVIQVHRLREVSALVGFTRFEAVMPDIDGEYDNNVERAQIAVVPTWFPAVENRGEGLFLQLHPVAMKDWINRTAVSDRIAAIACGHQRWMKHRTLIQAFPGGQYILLHTLSHLLIQSLSMRCGYPASSIRERIYVDIPKERFGILLYTATSDAEGTLGGLVQQARHIEDHLRHALRIGALCSNDPVCAQHEPGESIEGRWLHGAACHGCALVAETSCEMRNEYLDRALVVPVLGVPDAAYFSLEL